jgi:hypothetical protein
MQLLHRLGFQRVFEGGQAAAYIVRVEVYSVGCGLNQRLLSLLQSGTEIVARANKRWSRTRLSLLKCCVTVIASSDMRCAIVDDSGGETDRQKTGRTASHASEHGDRLGCAFNAKGIKRPTRDRQVKRSGRWKNAR